LNKGTVAKCEVTEGFAARPTPALHDGGALLRIRRRAGARSGEARRSGCLALGILAGCLFLDRSSAALGASPDSSAAAFSITRIESRIPPEPLSPWSAVEDEIERLVVRGELPFEARGFRPIDRGELAAWLRASAARGRASASPARRVLLDLLRWDLGWIERAGRGGKARGPKAEAKAWAKAGAKAGAKARNAPWSARGPIAGAKAGAVTPWSARGPGAGADPFTSPRPGTWVRFGADDRLLLLSPYARVMPRFETGREVAWTDSTRLGFRATYFGGRSLVIATGFYAAEVERGRSFADPLVADSDVILHADELTLSARLGALRLRIGRDRHQWGMGASGTLLLSESARPFDFVEYQLRLGERFRFLALTGITDRHAALSTPGSNPGEARFLSAHRLLWTVTPDLALGLSEGARYQADQPGLLYLGGFVPYTLVERLEMQDEPADSTEDFLRNNVLWSVDVSWRMRPGLLFYGEFLADDIATQSSSMPTRVAFQLRLGASGRSARIRAGTRRGSRAAARGDCPGRFLELQRLAPARASRRRSDRPPLASRIDRLRSRRRRCLRRRPRLVVRRSGAGVELRSRGTLPANGARLGGRSGRAPRARGAAQRG
jgi:hypothetical protein